MDKRILTNKLRLKNNSLNEVRSRILDIRTNIEELNTVNIQSLDSVDKETLKEDLQALHDELNRLEKDKKRIEQEIDEVQEQIDMYEHNLVSEGDEQRMNNNLDLFKKKRGMKRFIESRGLVHTGIPLENEAALLPMDELVQTINKREKLDLTKYVRVVKTGQRSGRFSFLKASQQVLARKSESSTFEKYSPNLVHVDFETETFGGVLPISSEMVDDNDFEVEDLVVDALSEMERNTKNVEICSILKQAQAKTVSGLDGIVSVLNNDLQSNYYATVVVSESLFTALDSLKDQTGRYLLQDDVTVASGKRIKGKEVVVVPDEVIGTNKGDTVGFIGDLHEYVALFDQKKVTLKWTDHSIYGLLLGGYTRFDVQPADLEAGFYITYTQE